MRRRSIVVAVAAALAGCFLPAPPPSPRYFAPIAPEDAPPTPPAAHEKIGVRLSPVRSPLHLREAMTWRRSDVEYGFYDQRRWTELPATYVERALAHELFGVEGFRVASTPDAPLVTAEVRSFEEVLAPAHEAVVGLRVHVARPDCVLLRRDVVARRALDRDDPIEVARGIGEALDEVARGVGAAVEDALAGGGRCAR
jgi:ABC-type uncharacterized transport system auxiliary subunit